MLSFLCHRRNRDAASGILRIVREAGMDIRPEAMKVTPKDVKDTVMELGQWSEANGCAPRSFPPFPSNSQLTLNNCRYMFTVANARQITEREVEEALNALYVAYGSPPIYAHD
jgi:hypothetical protein